MSKSKPAAATIKVELDGRKTRLSIAKASHTHATEQFDDALQALEKARKARDKAAAELLAAQEACVTP